MKFQSSLRERSLFMAGRGGRRKFRDPFSWGGATFFSIPFWGGDFFLMHYFANFFFGESDITCIIAVAGAQQQHKGMFLKHGVGGGQKFFQQCHGGRGDFFPHIREGGGGAFFFAYRFCRTTPPPPPPHPRP